HAMRFVEGKPLKDALDRFHRGQPASPSERSLAFRQLLDHFRAARQAVAYAHSRGVIHRDLKPASILPGRFAETLVVGREAGMREPGRSNVVALAEALGVDCLAFWRSRRSGPNRAGGGRRRTGPKGSRDPSGRGRGPDAAGRRFSVDLKEAGST